MKILLIVLIGLFGFNVSTFQSKEYVCLPCGHDCDGKVYSRAGTCQSCNMRLVEKSSIKFTNISPIELCQRATNSDALVLDVRSRGEFDGSSGDAQTFGHFRNAININVEELERRVNELNKYREKEILVYCSHAHRSAIASYFLSTHGFKDVKNMTGGVSTMQSQNECLKKSFVVHSH